MTKNVTEGTSDSHPAPSRSADGEQLLVAFRSVVVPLGNALPPGTEVVLHDLSVAPHSIAAIHGSLTGRRVGERSQLMTLERITDLSDDDLVTYESVMNDGRKVRSTTITIRDLSGAAVAALCINVDMTPWEAIHDIAASFVGAPPSGRAAPVPSGRPAPAVPVESGDGPAEFVSNLDDLAHLLIEREIAATGVPVDIMKKRHKVEVVRRLQERGLFLLREAVVQVAEALSVSRFTVYNYLNEIESAATSAEIE